MTALPKNPDRKMDRLKLFLMRAFMPPQGGVQGGQQSGGHIEAVLAGHVPGQEAADDKACNQAGQLNHPAAPPSVSSLWAVEGLAYWKSITPL